MQRTRLTILVENEPSKVCYISGISSAILYNGVVQWTMVHSGSLTLNVPVRMYPDSKVHGANMGPIWGRQYPGGLHVGPMNLAFWLSSSFEETSNSVRCIIILLFSDHTYVTLWIALHGATTICWSYTCVLISRHSEGLVHISMRDFCHIMNVTLYVLNKCLMGNNVS